MFEALLEEVVASTEGARASLVMDFDGISLASYVREDASPDIKTVGIELTVLLRAAKQAVSMLEVGSVEEVVLVAAHLTALVRIVNENYFVAIALAPGGNLGRARYLMRTRVSELMSELS